MRFGLMLLACLAIGCGNKRVSVESAPVIPEVCGPELMIGHVLSEVSECENVVIYQDIDMADIFYGVCEYGSDVVLVNVAMPTALYLSVQESVAEDGGVVLCSDDMFTIIDVPNK